MGFPAHLTLLFLTFVIASIALAADPPRDGSRASPTCPVRLPVPSSHPRDARVVGGKPADDFMRAHMVSFHYEGCGGSLISPRWAITAAHCIIQTSSTAYVGGRKSDSGSQVKIKAVYTHPDFQFPINDITLVEFAHDVPTSSKFMQVNVNSNVPEVDEYTRAAGYGFTAESNNPNVNSKLYQVDVPATEMGPCKTAYEDAGSTLAPFIEGKYHVCAGYEAGKCDSCTADSGGPLVVFNDKEELVQVAVVSFGYGCARKGIPGGYTRLSTYVKWMRNVGAEFTEASERKPVFLGGEDETATPKPTSSSPPNLGWPSPSSPKQSTEPSPTPSNSNGGGATDSPGSAGGGSGPNPSPAPSSDEGSSSQNPSVTNPPGSDGDASGSASPEPFAGTGSNESDKPGSSAGSSDTSGRLTSGSGVNVGAIVGGVIGGLAVVAVAVAMFILYRRRAAPQPAASASAAALAVPAETEV